MPTTVKKNKRSTKVSATFPAKKTLSRKRSAATQLSDSKTLLPDIGGLASGERDVSDLIQFLKTVQLMSHPEANEPSKLISIKVQPALLAAFRFKAQSQGVPYQTMIKRLMHEWLMSPR